jgi:hypothetical protein
LYSTVRKIPMPKAPGTPEVIGRPAEERPATTGMPLTVGSPTTVLASRGTPRAAEFLW